MASRATQYRTAEPALIEQRRAPRHLVAIAAASVRKHAQQPAEAVLLELSIYGCRIESAGAYAPGERVWLRFTGSLPIAAEVVWSAEGVVGCRFDSPIDRSLVRSLVLTIR